MKTLITFSFAAFIFTAASAQEKNPTPVGPETKPAMNVQTQQNTQNTSTPKTNKSAKSEPKKSQNAKEVKSVDNKIAVSDPGASDRKKDPSNTSEKKTPSNSGVSPK